MMKLVEDRKVDLDEKVFTILNDLTPPLGRVADPRLNAITVRHALSHTSGWHADGKDDPLWMSRVAAVALNDTTPASARTLARYWMGLPLSFAPGTDWSYGQIGYILAHLVMEKRSGKSYEQYVRDNVLTPVGATSIAPGKSRLEDRRPNEVTYYYPGTMNDNTRLTGTVPAAYGWHAIEGTISGAGWSGTAVDYLRFFAGIDQNATRADVLTSASVDRMLGRPLSIWDSNTTWYGLGWYSRGTGPNSVIYHGGNTWGTANWVRRLDNGVVMVLLTNGPVAPNEQSTFTLINNALVQGAGMVTSWPTTDYFSRF
jgi:CubicO group peptidase (beta-lactamase class C family)